MSVARKLLKQKTARDRQTLAGPSSLGSACDACVALALSNESEGENHYWVGAAIGTAVHDLLEKRARRQRNVLLEQKVTVGEIPGYGVIRGSVDRFEIKTGTVRDFKGTTRDKFPAMRNAYEGDLKTLVAQEAQHKMEGYLGQMHLYGLALHNEGYEVNQVALDFFARDGKTDADFLELKYEFKLDFAQAVWERALYIHKNLGKEKFASHPHCIGCMLR